MKATKRRTPRIAVAVAAIGALVVIAAVGVAAALRTPAESGRADAGAATPIPDDKISIQLFTFFHHIGFGEDADAQARQADVLARLSEAGYRYVEPHDYTAFQGLDASEYRALLDEYDLKVSSLHTSVTVDTTDDQWASKLETARTLGAAYVGPGETPRTYSSRAEWETFAARIDTLGAQARAQGVTLLVHLHDWEFTSVYGDQSAFEILLAHTSPDNVAFELDLYWATAAGEDPRALVTEHGDRIPLLHVKDMAADGAITTAGEGVIDFPSVFAAAGPNVAFYVIERDPPDDPSFDPFGPALAGRDYLRTVRFSSA